MLFDLIEESKKLISIRSDEGNRGVVECLMPHCRRLGFHITIQGAGNGCSAVDANLIAHSSPGRLGDVCPEGLVLVTHLDTVPPGRKSLWTKTGGNPFKPTIRGGKLYGLGSADTKLDFLCKLLAIQRVGLKRIKIPVAMVGTFGEERALAGARLVRESGIMHPRFALISEPSELRAVIAHKGILYLRAVLRDKGATGRSPCRTKVFKGKAAHGSMPHLGENAIEKAIWWLATQKGIDLVEIDGGTVHNVVPCSCRIATRRSIKDSPRIVFLKRFLELMGTARRYLLTHSNPNFDPSRTTDNIGVIRTPSKDRVEIEFDFRLIPETDGNVLFEIFQGLGKGIAGVSIAVIRSNPPMNTPLDSELARRVGEAQVAAELPQAFVVKSGNTEGAVFNELGAESIVIGPGRSVGNIHAPNEYNEISQLKKAVDFYAAFLQGFC